MVAAARSCVGVRFRTHGRDQDGLDCVGLAGVAFGVEGLPRDYALRGGDPAAVGRMIEGAGLMPVNAPEAGDLVLVEAGAGQLHLVVTTDAGHVHAHAWLRRVVETPGPPAGRVLGAWRQAGGD